MPLMKASLLSDYNMHTHIGYVLTVCRRISLTLIVRLFLLIALSTKHITESETACKLILHRKHLQYDNPDKQTNK